MAQQKQKNSWLLVALPLIIVVGLGIVFYIQLGNEDKEKLPSTMLGKAAPEMTLDALAGLVDDENLPIKGIAKGQFENKISLVNIFASWCTPCRAEHPLLVDISKEIPELQMIGINLRDKPDNALKFLNSLGNPYDIVGVDPMGRASVEWGGYGVPETFIVDQKGMIRHKQIGPISRSYISETLLPLVEKMKSEN